MIKALASYEHALDSVHATEAKLSQTLAFAPSPGAPPAPTSPTRPAKCLLLFPPAASSPQDSSSPPNSASEKAQRKEKEQRYDTTPVALALYYHSYSTWLAVPGLFLEDLFVLESHRSRGYGTLLLATLAREVLDMASASASGGPGGAVGAVGRLEWNVLKWNEPSLRFYGGSTVGAERLEEWVGMRVEGVEGLRKLARRLE